MASFNPWLAMQDAEGQNMPPDYLTQLLGDDGMNSMPPPEGNQALNPEELAPAGPPEPQVVSPPPQRVPLTAQFTTQPLGTLPQEVVPTQPSMIDDGSGGTSMLEQLKAYSMMSRPVANPRLDRELAQYEQNFNDQNVRQRAAQDTYNQSVQNYETGAQGIDFRPLAAISDSFLGSKLYQAANDMAPDSAAMKRQKLALMLRDAASGEGDLSKSQLDAVKQKSAQQQYMESRQSKEQMAKQAMLAGLTKANTIDPLRQIRAGVAQDRLAAQAADVFDKDSILRKNETLRQQIELDKHTLDTATTLTPQIFNEIQIGLARAISGGGQTAVTTQEKTEFSSLNNQLKSLQQRISNRPEDIGSPEVRLMLSDTMKRLSDAYKMNSHSRARQLRSGRERAYTHNPDALAVMDAKVQSYVPEPQAATGSGPAIGEIVDGHKYLGGDPNDPNSWEQ